MHRVIKIGGSLLTNPHFPSRLTAWLDRQTPAARTTVIAGGGEAIEAMRRLDRIHPLDTTAMHWRCVRLLRATFEITAELFPDWQPVDTAESFRAYQNASTSAGVYLLAVDTSFVPGAQPQLPESWATTTDAIAAHLCLRLNADEVVLLKSCAVPPAATSESLAAAGVIDAAILPLVDQLPHLRIETLPAGSA